MQRVIEILRQWEIPLAILLGYYIVAALVIEFMHHRYWRHYRPANPRRYRFRLALILAIVFTPSVISDFWLFMVPGPAVLELLLLLTGFLSHPWFTLSHPLATLYVLMIVCLLPLAVGFGIFYFSLWLWDRRRQFMNCKGV
jgi:hypothetical protein